MLWIITKTRAVAAGLGPSEEFLLLSFLSSSVSTKQKVPGIVWKIWLQLPYAACVDTWEKKSGARGASEQLTCRCRCEVRLADVAAGQTGRGLPPSWYPRETPGAGETQVGTDIKKERAGLWKQDEKAPQGQGLACRPWARTFFLTLEKSSQQTAGRLQVPIDVSGTDAGNKTKT